MSNYSYDMTEVAIDRLESDIRSSAITVALDYSIFDNNVVTVYFKKDLSPEDENILQGLIDNHIPESLAENKDNEVTFNKELLTNSKLLKVSSYEPEGDSATIVSHNFCDKSTWYSGSVKVSDETISYNDGVWKSSKTHWIDLTHGRIYDEDFINTGGMYNPVIKVNGSVNNDAVINYDEGSFTIEGISSSDTVTASYYYATTSFYSLKPKPGKILSIKAAEVQFTQDVQITSPFVFEAWAWITHPTYGRIQVAVPGSRIMYKNAKDFISAANEGQGLIPKWGELNSDVHVFPFHYARPKPLKASQEVEIRVFILDHSEVIGQFATSTFYVTIDNETT